MYDLQMGAVCDGWLNYADEWGDFKELFVFDGSFALMEKLNKGNNV
jgi:hypothetical protein